MNFTKLTTGTVEHEKILVLNNWARFKIHQTKFTSILFNSYSLYLFTHCYISLFDKPISFSHHLIALKSTFCIY